MIHLVLIEPKFYAIPAEKIHSIQYPMIRSRMEVVPTVFPSRSTRL